MGKKFRDLVREHSTQKRGCRAVLNVLANYANEDGEVWCSNDTIADEAGLSVRAVQYNIDALIKSNEIGLAKAGNGRGHATRYKLNHETPELFLQEKGAKAAPFMDQEKGAKDDIKGASYAQRVQVTQIKGAKAAPDLDIDRELDHEGSKTPAQPQKAEPITEPAKPTPPPTALKENEYLPGIPDPRKTHWRKEHVQVTEYIARAKKLGLSAERFRLLVDEVLEGCGKKVLVDKGGEQGEKILNRAQSVTAQIIELDERFRAKEDIQEIFNSWHETYPKFTTPPSSEQLLEHASLIVSGKLKPKASEQAQQKQPLNFKRWLLAKHGCDNPQFLNIPRMVLDEQYNQYRNQQTH